MISTGFCGIANSARLRITNGVRTTVAGTEEGQYALLAYDGEFLGIGTCKEERIKADKIFARKSL